jgi:hypothetical protein
MLPRPLPRASTIWLGIIGGAAALDWWCDMGDPDEDTISECCRKVFAVHTPPGRVAFTVALAAGSTWLHSHILKQL